MRPKKVILLVDRSQGRRGVTRFVLDVWRYRVIVAHDELEAAAVLANRDQKLDIVIAFAPMKERLIGEVAFRHQVNSLMVRDKEQTDEGWCDRTMLAPSMADFLEAVKVMTTRKRGPKPTTVRRKPVRYVALADIFSKEVLAA